MGEGRRRRIGTSELWIRACLSAAILAFAVSAALALALAAYCGGLWGTDVLAVEVTLPEALGGFASLCALVGAVLLAANAIHRKNSTLEMELRAATAGGLASYGLRIEGGKAIRGEEEIPLTPQEFRLLQCLAARERQVCEYEHIIQQVWPEESRSDMPPGRDNLAALVRMLREKVNVHEYVRNHPGCGYELVQWEP
jgi:hypothetical protein